MSEQEQEKRCIELKRKIKLSDFMLDLIALVKEVHRGYDWNEYYTYW